MEILVNLYLLKENLMTKFNFKINNLSLLKQKEVLNFKNKIFVLKLQNCFQFLVRKRRMKIFKMQTHQVSLKICFIGPIQIKKTEILILQRLLFNSLRDQNKIQTLYIRNKG